MTTKKDQDLWDLYESVEKQRRRTETGYYELPDGTKKRGRQRIAELLGITRLSFLERFLGDLDVELHQDLVRSGRMEKRR